MSSRNLYISATIACMTGGLFGYSVGFIGGILVLPSFLHHFRLDELPARDIASAQSGIVTSWLIGCVIGVPLSVPICSKYGRRTCLAFCSSLYIIGAILQLLDVHRLLSVFQLGRFLNGIGVGAGTLVSPVYISEISPAAQRGALMSGYQVAIQIFALIGFWGAFTCNSIFPTTSNLQWQVPVSFQFVPGVILFIGSLVILPESPRWLTTKGDHDAARVALSWLRQHDPEDEEVSTEIAQIQKIVSINVRAEAVSDKKSFIRQIVTRPVRKRMIVGSLIMIFQNLVGLNALNYFSPIIFMSAGFTSVSASLFLTGLFGLVKLITALLFMFVFVRVRGNRFWLLLGSAIMAVAMFVLAFCIEQMPHPETPNVSSLSEYGIFSVLEQISRSDVVSVSALTGYGVVSVLMVYVFAFAFGVSLGPISWNVCSEIFPTSINTQACAVTTCIQWLSQILIASITPPMIASIGWGTYCVYGSFCVLSFIWCAFSVPETRGVAIGPDMDKAFGESPKDDVVVEVAEVEDIDEQTPLISKRRRRSSAAIVV